MSGLKCFVRYNNVPMPEQQKAGSFLVILSSSSTTFCPMKAGVPGVNVLHKVCTSSVSIVSRLLIIVGCPNEDHLPSLLLITCTPR